VNSDVGLFHVLIIFVTKVDKFSALWSGYVCTWRDVYLTHIAIKISAQMVNNIKSVNQNIYSYDVDSKLEI
jgi:hypothetical protein